jgi:D-arginine dehydrogenase
MTKVDILIVGGGIAGAGLAAALGDGRTILLIEAEDQPGYHSTGRSAAFWHEGYGGPLVAPLSRASRPMLEAGGYLGPRGAIHLARDDMAIELVDGVVATPLDRSDLEERLNGLRPSWTHGAYEPGLADIDVARLHADQLANARRAGTEVRPRSRLVGAARQSGAWEVALEDGSQVTADLIVDAAGAWGDAVARVCGVAPLGLSPKRRTMVQLRVDRDGLRDLPLVIGADESFYFKGAGDRSLWLSPHDEIDGEACDAAPEEIDVATAIHRFGEVVDWRIEAVERRWAGLRTFTPDRVPAIGSDPDEPGFFWCVGQGGFGIQTAPAAAQLGAALIIGSGDIPAGVDPATYDPARLR